MNKSIRSASLLLFSFMLLCGFVRAENTYDIVVYGGTCSGITAAIQAKRMGKDVILVCPEEHLGGLTVSGLGWTDTKDTNCIGGLSREFYHRIWQYYNDPEAWVYQSRSSYNVGWQAGSAVQESTQTMWTFEPHVAEEVFQHWLDEENITVVRNRWLDRSEGGVIMQGNTITAIKTMSYNSDFGFSAAETYSAKMFIDTSYEGDLMAAAGVSYRIGRDNKNEYNETLNGIYFKSTDLSPSKSPYKNIDPYVVPGNPDSGYIRQIEGEFNDQTQIGKADGRLQAFNFRMCMTDVSSNKVPVEKPAAYDERDYELLFRLYEAGQDPGFTDQRMPNLKTDNNNSGLMSLDWPGGNYSASNNWIYSEADYTERMNYVKRQRDYQQGLIWTMQYHPRVPSTSRSKRVKWGLPLDEFADNGHWPYFSYVREARRLEGEMVMTEHHVKMHSGYQVEDSIGQGSYSLDSHVVRRVVIDGAIWDEGGFYQWWSTGYPISYKSIVPKREQADNLLVPVCLSASHAAFGSIRMEPTYMILGQSAASAAALAIDYEYDIQDVPYGMLRTQLLHDGQRLKETFTADRNSVLLNFGTQINDNNVSPAHAVGKVTGTNWNLITADKSSGIVTADGIATALTIDLGKTLPSQSSIDWNRHGFVNSSLGDDFSSGIYAGNARSAIFVNDGKGSHVALGVKVSGLNSGVYAVYATANNTNTTAHDSYNVYAFETAASAASTDFDGLSAAALVNSKEDSSWMFDENFIAPIVSVDKGNDLVIVVEGLAGSEYRAFLNTVEIVQLASSPLAPVAVIEPQSFQIDLSGQSNVQNASFDFVFKSPLPPVINWYKVNGDDDILLVENEDYSISGPFFSEDTGEYLTTLAIQNINATDAGSYYCSVENDEGLYVSKTADITVCEMIAHWSLNSADYQTGKYVDLSGYGRDMTVNGSPVFVDGADQMPSGALGLTSTNGTGTIGNWDPLQDTGKFSIACWVYYTGGSDTSIIVDKSNSWNASDMMWVWGINPNTNKINFVAADSSDFQTPIDPDIFAANQWHHLIVTYDSDTTIAQLYIDMKLVNSGQVVMGTKKDSIMHFGIDAGSRYFHGKLDDLRIYNCVLDERGILNAYNGAALNKASICYLDSYDSTLDLSGPNDSADCIIDSYDLAAFAGNWLSTGSYPQ